MLANADQADSSDVQMWTRETLFSLDETAVWVACLGQDRGVFAREADGNESPPGVDSCFQFTQRALMCIFHSLVASEGSKWASSNTFDCNTNERDDIMECQLMQCERRGDSVGGHHGRPAQHYLHEGPHRGAGAWEQCPIGLFTRNLAKMQGSGFS